MQKLIKKGKVNFFYKNEMLTPERIVYFSRTLSHQVFNNFFFLPCTFSQTLTNAARPIPLKWTNAIRMHLALIPRAHTTVLAILCLLEMVLIVKVSLVFKGDVICILFPTLNVAVNCLELTSEIHIEEVDFHPEFTSRRHKFTLLCAQKRIAFSFCFKCLTTLHELLHDTDMTPSVELKNI